MIQVERFCTRVQSLVDDRPGDSDTEAFRLKLNQSRSMLADLQRFYNEDKLGVENAAVRSEFRCLIISLLWVAFHARKIIDYKTFRMLVSSEAAFSLVIEDYLNCDPGA